MKKKESIYLTSDQGSQLKKLIIHRFPSSMKQFFTAYGAVNGLGDGNVSDHIRRVINGRAAFTEQMKARLARAVYRKEKDDAPLTSHEIKQFERAIGLFGSAAKSASASKPRGVFPPNNLTEPPKFFFGHVGLRRKVAANFRKKGITVFHELTGTGKTALAKLLADNALRRNSHPGGVVWINCEKDLGSDECVDAIARILFGNSSIGRPAIRCKRSVMDHFSTHHTLLVFDNFEVAIHRDDLNHLIREFGAAACVLIASQQIHEGLLKHVVPFPTLTASDAEALFLHEAGMTDPTYEDRVAINEVCKLVAYLPAAILRLVDCARKAGLWPLYNELYVHGIEVLANGDRFLSIGKRSFTDCLETAFDRLGSARDQDTISRFAMTHDGVGKEFAISYLSKVDALASITNCLNSALLKLASGRYWVHPLALSFLRNKRHKRKAELERHFINYFCNHLDEAANAERLPSLYAQEGKNCYHAVKEAANSKSPQHLLVVMEMLPAARLIDDEMANRTLTCALAEARTAKNVVKMERILIARFQQLGERAEDLAELSRLNEACASGLRFDASARTSFENCELGAAELELRKSIAAWEDAGTRHHSSRTAARTNLLIVLLCQKRTEEAALMASDLLTVCSQAQNFDLLDTSGCFSPELERGGSWARSTMERDVFANLAWCEFCHSSDAGERLSEFISRVGGAFFRLNEWQAARNWLEVSVRITDAVAVNERVTNWRKPSLLLAKTYVILKEFTLAERTFQKIIDNPPCVQVAWQHTIQEKALLGMAMVAAERRRFKSAAAFGAKALVLCQKTLSFQKKLGNFEDVGEIPLNQLVNMIGDWRRKANDHKR